MSGNGRMFTTGPAPFAFKRGQCFLCSEKAVSEIAGEPVCTEHLQRIEVIKHDAEQGIREGQAA
jgi:hypothetical protein